MNATGPDGTTFTLEIPKGAITEDTVVTMTPVDSIDGLPFSAGLVGGVQLGPDGLRLRQPALLTVEPVSPVPVAEQVGFAYAGTGQDLYLAPLAPRTDIMQVQVLHFSGAGVGRGSASDVDTVIPESPLARLQQKVAEAIQRDREQGKGDLSDETLALLEDAFAEHQAYLDPLMKQAETDCALAHKVVPEQLALLRQMILLGTSESAIESSMYQVVGAALDNCAKEATDALSKLCEEGASLEELQAATARAVGYERERQLLGADSESSISLTLQKVIDECKPRGWSGTITLLETSDTSVGGWDATSKSRASITLLGGVGRWEATVSGTSTATNLTQGCAKNGTLSYSGQGSVSLNVEGGGGRSDRGGGQPSEDEGEIANVDISIDPDGIYSLNFFMPLEGSSRIVMTGRPDRCEVGEDVEEEMTSLGASVQGKGEPKPQQLTGSHSEPVEDFEGKTVGQRTVTWNLSRR